MKISAITTNSYKPSFGLRLGNDLQEKIVESLNRISDNYSPAFSEYVTNQTYMKIKEMKRWDAEKEYILNYSSTHESLVLQPLDGLDWYDKDGNYYKVGSATLIPAEGNSKEFLDEFLSFSKDKYLNIRKKSIDTYLNTSEDFFELTSSEAKKKAEEIGSTSGALFLKCFSKKYF